MKLVFILVVTAFTICLSRELPRHRHKKMFSQRRETMQQDAYIGPKPGTQHNKLFLEYCKVQPCHASLGYPFHNTAAHTEATPTREGI